MISQETSPAPGGWAMALSSGTERFQGKKRAACGGGLPPVPRQKLVHLWNQRVAHTGQFRVPLLESRLPGHDLDMLRAILATLPSLCRTRADLLLEILALRQQLAVLKHGSPRPRLSSGFRLFWVTLRRIWPRWKQPLALVQPQAAASRNSWRTRWPWRFVVVSVSLSRRSVWALQQVAVANHVLVPVASPQIAQPSSVVGASTQRAVRCRIARR